MPGIWGVFSWIGWMFMTYPGGLILLFLGLGSIAMLTTEFVERVGRRTNQQQQRMYERQETVFYVSPRDKTLLRPAQTPPADPGELLRSAEPALSALPTDMLRASGAANDGANTK